MSEARVDRDPIEIVDMSEELTKTRELFKSRGYACKASNSNGEVWERGMAGNPGYRWTLFTDQGGRIRAELKNPVGGIVTEVSRLNVIDVEMAMGQYGVG